MNSPKIGETVHYVRLNGACLPALVVGYSAAIAAAKRSADADYLLATAQEDMKAAQDASKVAAKAVGKGGGVATVEEAEAAVTTLTAQRNALAWIDEKNAALADAQASADASHAAEADAVGVLDLQIFGNGESDGEAAGAVFGLAPTSAGGAWDIPLTVLRKGVAHDAQSAPNTWHLMSEE